LRWPARLVATTVRKSPEHPAQSAHVVCGGQRLPNNRDL
jgi:hypothetical protein